MHQTCDSVHSSLQHIPEIFLFTISELVHHGNLMHHNDIRTNVRGFLLGDNGRTAKGQSER